jgi:hypothetical protein
MWCAHTTSDRNAMLAVAFYVGFMILTAIEGPR